MKQKIYTNTNMFVIIASIFLAIALVLVYTSKSEAAACTAPTVDRGTVSSTVSIPTSGTYAVWSRIMPGTASTDNSYLLEIDGTTCYVVGDNNAIPVNSWTWVDYQNGTTTTKTQLSLTAGNHTIKMIGREDAVKLDRVIFTSDLACVPTGMGDNCANPPDTTAPTVAVSAPTNNTTVQGTVNLQATASDTGGTVASVSYYIDGSTTVVGTATTAPYTIALNTTTLSDGTHTVTAKARDAAGNIGTSSAITITVQNNKPDLIVTGITFNPATPVVGNAVTFSATIKNQGTAATPAGTVHSVLFSVDGTAKTWANTYSASIAPGATVTVTANAGTTGATWTATSGAHTIRATVDDTSKITEGNEGNNTLDVSLTPGSGDTTAPNTSVQTPLPNAVVKGTYKVVASATDSVGVTKVDFYIDGVYKTTDTSAPYEYQWNTTTATNATHTISTRATDAAGNVGASPSITVTVDNSPPVTSITAPANGATISGTSQQITANATDNVAVTAVEFYVDGVKGATDNLPSYVFTMDTTKFTNGSHTLTTRAYDSAGNVTTSAPITVTIANNTTTAPKPGDVDEDGVIGPIDASILLGNWGKTGMTRKQGNLNNDTQGLVDIYDASILLANWGK